MPVAYHLTFRLKDSRVIAPYSRTRRRLARSFVEIGDRHGLLSFRIVLEHGHALFACDRQAAGRAAQAIGSSITQALALPEGFNETHIRTVEDQHQLESVFRYILGNARKHGADDDPLHEASVLPDLLGLRLLGSDVEERVRAYLPRATWDEVRGHLGVAPTELVFSPNHLADSAAAVFALPDLKGRTPQHVLARAAAARLGTGQLRVDAVARILGVAPTTVYALRDLAVPEAVLTAVRRGMALRAALGDRLVGRLAPRASQTIAVSSNPPT